MVDHDDDVTTGADLRPIYMVIHTSTYTYYNTLIYLYLDESEPSALSLQEYELIDNTFLTHSGNSHLDPD